jgi:hypothetical protein
MIDGKQTRLVFRMEKIARLRAAGIKDARVAQLVGMTAQGLARIVSLPEYQNIEKNVLATVVNLLDDALADNVNACRDHFANAIPAAMRAVVDTLHQSKDLRSRLDAAREVLDRDPSRTFVKDQVSVKEGGRVLDIPLQLFDTAVKAGASVAAGTQGVSRSLAEAMVPRALEHTSEDEDEQEKVEV